MKCQRKKFLIDRSVQGALVKRVILHWLLLIGCLVVLLPVLQLISSGFPMSRSSVSMIGMSLRNTPIYIILLALLPALVWDTVKLSHRFTGPMYRIQSGIRKLAAGEKVDPIELRKDDFWSDMARDFNAIVTRVQSCEDEELVDRSREFVPISKDKSA